jgi:hypothetical protein
MLIDGEPTGWMIRAAQHPTALRPYYIETETGAALTMRYSKLDRAKAELLANYKLMRAINKLNGGNDD